MKYHLFWFSIKLYYRFGCQILPSGKLHLACNSQLHRRSSWLSSCRTPGSLSYVYQGAKESQKGISETRMWDYPEVAERETPRSQHFLISPHSFRLHLGLEFIICYLRAKISWWLVAKCISFFRELCRSHISSTPPVFFSSDDSIFLPYW